MRLKKNIKLFFIVAGIILFGIIASRFISKSELCNEIVISFNESEKGKYLSADMINDFINKKIGKTEELRLSEINTGQLEAALDSFPQIKKVNVYKTRKGKLHVEIDERQPLCRLYAKNGNSLYIDREGIFMPLYKKTPARVPVISGDFVLPDSIIEKNIVLDSIKYLKNIFELTKYIQNDDFFSSQIQQIYLDSTENIIMIPRVGNHDVCLGTFNNYKEKLYRLKYFYFNVMGNVGWNKYKRLDLRFDKQIVATKN